MVAILFCDESGNTGPDWGNRDQPIWVHGGWLTPNSRDLTTFRDGIVRHKRRHRLQSTELKSSSIVKRGNSSEILRDFFQLGKDLSAVPIFYVADKAFLLGAKIVESYFDPG